MKLLKPLFTKIAQWRPFQIYEEINKRALDGIPDKEWVEQTFKDIKKYKRRLKSMRHYASSLNLLLYKAIESHATEVVDEITDKFTDEINQDNVGHLFELSANKVNLESMKHIYDRLCADNDKENNIARALLNGAFQENTELIDFLAANYFNQVTESAVKRAFNNSAAFARTENAKQIIVNWGGFISEKEAQDALERSKTQRSVDADGSYDYAAYESFIYQKFPSLKV